MDEYRDAHATAARIRERLSYANVIATIAVFGVLAGGAYAASKIGPNDIKQNAVRAKHIKKNQVRGKHVNEQTLSATPLATRVVQGGCRPAVPGTGEMVKVGAVCIDRYESSLWTRPNGGERITGEIPCNANGQDCEGIYARSVPGARPRSSITWFQAQQALANSGKRLPSNAEWQQAVAGTPDGAPCNVNSSGLVNTGSAAGCVSDHGANDMVGNLYEWVADWVPQSTCTGGSWPSSFGGDFQGICGAASTGAPGALIRGGDFSSGTDAGPFAVSAFGRPSSSFVIVGFRGAR